MDNATVSQSPVGRAREPERLTWGPAEVAAALGITEDAFRASRPRLEEAGFPQRLPVLRARWSIRAVRAWVAIVGTREEITITIEGTP